MGQVVEELPCTDLRVGALLSALGNLDQVISKLGLHRSVYLVHLGTENNLVELGHHLAG